MPFKSAVAVRLLVVVAIAAVPLAGCGSKKKKSTATTAGVPAVAKNAKIAAEVPAAIRKKGTLTVAADATYPPNEFIQGGKVIGMDPDFATALGQVMGLKFNVKNVTFDAIIAGLQAKKYDLGMSSFTDTKEREKTLDFVTYLIAGTEFLVKAKGGPAITSLSQLCGHKVALEKGTTQQDFATGQAKKCKASGKSLTVLAFPDQNGANLALSSGRADVGMADSPVADYFAGHSNGQFKLVGKPFGDAPYGIAVPKNNGMARPVLDALKVLIANGTYKAILDKWNITHFAVKHPTINGAIS